MPRRLHRVDDEVVLFDSWRGAYSDNPRAVAEALHRRRPELRQLWVAAAPGETWPEWATRVRPETRQYLEALGTARHVVTNINMPAYYRKPAAATYVQTWHGTPLKRIAFDIERPAFSGHKKYLTALRADVRKWDFLLSPNPFSTEIFRQAFDFEGEVIESGYPRNDVLSAPDAAKIGRAVRTELGISEQARVVLYAPTWRDTRAFSLELDVARLVEELGSDHVLLLRTHHLDNASLAALERPGVLDVSGHVDIRELYLAADVLITDYSSAMFDFAVTGKPMLFFTYDLAEYRDEVRGFYFDFEEDAPGPLLATSADVCSALADLDAVKHSYAGAYARFAERFCALEDGGAADRVIDAVFR